MSRSGCPRLSGPWLDPRQRLELHHPGGVDPLKGENGRTRVAFAICDDGSGKLGLGKLRRAQRPVVFFVYRGRSV